MVMHDHSDLVLGLRFGFSELATLVVTCVSERTRACVHACAHVHPCVACVGQRLTSG